MTMGSGEDWSGSTSHQVVSNASISSTGRTPADQAGLNPRAAAVARTRYRQSKPDPELSSTDKVKQETPTVRLIVNASLALVCSLIAVVAWQRGLWPVSVVCWFIGAHFMHTFALSFHDAVHGTLHPNSRVNELLGLTYGTVTLIPLTVYRRAHVLHHANLGSARDPELYPFVIPGTSRAYRILCAALELCFGFVFTPMLFLRSFLLDPTVTPAVRRRVLAEYAAIVLMVTALFVTVSLTGTWYIYFYGILAPELLAGNYQTIRKYTEHMGLHGTTVLESTRSILPRDYCNETISFLVQHVDHHGTHHVHGRIPFYELPEASNEVYGGRVDDLPVFRSYAVAFCDMLPTLLDPKVGRQWRD